MESATLTRPRTERGWAARLRAVPATGWAAAGLAARGYIDIPYLALVVWAGALEVARPRRGLPVFLLLSAASLLRPEAWIIIGLYWLWFAWKAPWRARIGFAALAAIGPLAWAF